MDNFETYGSGLNPDEVFKIAQDHVDLGTPAKDDLNIGGLGDQTSQILTSSFQDRENNAVYDTYSRGRDATYIMSLALGPGADKAIITNEFNKAQSSSDWNEKIGYGSSNRLEEITNVTYNVGTDHMHHETTAKSGFNCNDGIVSQNSPATHYSDYRELISKGNSAGSFESGKQLYNSFEKKDIEIKVECRENGIPSTYFMNYNDYQQAQARGGMYEFGGKQYSDKDISIIKHDGSKSSLSTHDIYGNGVNIRAMASESLNADKRLNDFNNANKSADQAAALAKRQDAGYEYLKNRDPELKKMLGDTDNLKTRARCVDIAERELKKNSLKSPII